MSPLHGARDARPCAHLTFDSMPVAELKQRFEEAGGAVRELQCLEKRELRRVVEGKCGVANPPPTPPPAQPTAKAAAGEEAEGFEVEVVQEERFLGAEPEYLVKWVGYSEKENSWEPQSALWETAGSASKR